MILKIIKLGGLMVHSQWIKIFLYSLVALAMLAYQCVLLYGFERTFPDIWRSFGIEQSSWSKFVTDSLRYWWFGVKVEVILWIYTLINFRIKNVLLTLMLSLLVICALLWAIYNPAMLL